MIVADASVVVKWIQEEDDRDKALVLRKDHLEGKNEILVPRFLFIEIANTVATKFSLSSLYIEQGMKFLYSSNLLIHEEKEDEIVQAAILANKFRLSVYDMLYAVIAKKHKTILITADERFIQKTKFPFVKLLSKYKV